MKRLRLLSLRQQNIFKHFVLTFSCLKRTASVYPFHLVSHSQPARDLRSAVLGKLTVSLTRLQSGGWFFFSAAPMERPVWPQVDEKGEAGEEKNELFDEKDISKNEKISNQTITLITLINSNSTVPLSVDFILSIYEVSSKFVLNKFDSSIYSKQRSSKLLSDGQQNQQL